MSVQRAYTRVELRALLAGANLRPVAEVAGVARASRRDRRRADADAATRPAPAAGRAVRPARGRRRRRRRRSGGRRRRPRTSRGPATRWWSSSARRRGAGGRAACSPRRPRCASCAGPGSTPPTLARVARPIPAMRVESPRGHGVPAHVRRRGGPARPRVGFDRSALDPALLDLAAAAGARRPCGVAACGRRPAPTSPDASVAGRRDGRRTPIEARVVVGADGPRSIVASAAGVIRRPGARRPGRADLARRGRRPATR